MGLRSPKPKQRNINISTLKPDRLEYFCKTQVIDKIICLQKKIDFNQQMADELEKPYPFYFIVKKDFEYDVISGLILDPWLKEHNISELPESDKSKACIKHYIKSIR